MPVRRHTALHAVGASMPECSLRVGHPEDGAQIRLDSRPLCEHAEMTLRQIAIGLGIAIDPRDGLIAFHPRARHARRVE